MVLTPAFVKMRFIWGAISGIYPMHANGLYSSSVVISHLNGSSSKRFWFSDSVGVCVGLGPLRLSFVFVLLVFWSGGVYVWAICLSLLRS